MAQHKYSYPKYEQESMARSVGTDLPISTKQSLEICNMIRGKNLTRAKTMLNEVIRMDNPVPFRRFTNGLGHRKGNLASGRYPIKASSKILGVLESAETNAQQKGLNTSKLAIIHLAAQKGSRPMRMGRHRGRLAKRTHVEVVLAEVEEKSGKKKRNMQMPAKDEGSKKKTSEITTIKDDAKKMIKKEESAKKEDNAVKEKQVQNKPDNDDMSKGGDKK